MYELDKYKHEINADGELVVYDVPIFAEVEREEDDGTVLDFDEDWIREAVEKAQRRYEIDGYMPPFHLEHNAIEPSATPIVRKNLGRFLPTRVEILDLSEVDEETGEITEHKKAVPIADLVIRKECIEEFALGRYPYLSVEINNPSVREFSSLAALPSRPPEVKRSPLAIFPVQFSEKKKHYFSEEKVLAPQRFGVKELAQKIALNWSRVKAKLFGNPKYQWLISKIDENSRNIDPKTGKHSGGEVVLSPDTIASWLRSIPWDQLSGLIQAISFSEESKQMADISKLTNLLNKFEAMQNKGDKLKARMILEEIFDIVDQYPVSEVKALYPKYPFLGSYLRSNLGGKFAESGDKNMPNDQDKKQMAWTKEDEEFDKTMHPGGGAKPAGWTKEDEEFERAMNPKKYAQKFAEGKVKYLDRTWSREGDFWSDGISRMGNNNMQTLLKSGEAQNFAEDDSEKNQGVKNMAEEKDPQQMDGEGASPIDQITALLSSASPDVLASILQLLQHEGAEIQAADGGAIPAPIAQFASIRNKRGASLEQKFNILCDVVKEMITKQEREKAIHFAEKRLAGTSQKSAILQQIKSKRDPNIIRELTEFAKNFAAQDPEQLSEDDLSNNRVDPKVAEMMKDYAPEEKEKVMHFAEQWENSAKSMPCERFVKIQLKGYQPKNGSK